MEQAHLLPLEKLQNPRAIFHILFVKTLYSHCSIALQTNAGANLTLDFQNASTRLENGGTCCSKWPGHPAPVLQCSAHFKGSSSCCIWSCSQRALLKGTGQSLSQRPHQQTSRLALFWQSTYNGILGFY